MQRKFFLFLLTFFLVFISTSTSVHAQNSTDYPVYVVQPGETLTIIAQKFNTTVEEIISLNGILNPDLISQGTELYIPGLEGITGRLVTQAVNLGETIEELAKANSLSAGTLLSLNKITSPNEVYVGTNLIIPVGAEGEQLLVADSIDQETALIQKATIFGVNPWQVLDWNDARTSNQVYSGKSLYASIQSEQAVSRISPLVESVAISPLPLEQGNTIVVSINTTQPMNVTGKLGDYDLQFFNLAGSENSYYAIQGIHAMADPGLVNFSISGASEDGNGFAYDQMLLQQAGIFIQDPPLYVQDETVDPAVTGPEEDQVRAVISQITSDKLWNGPFRYPVDGSVEDDTIGFMSTYGNRRSYNGSDYIFFHTGLDFGVFINNLNIYAPANGKVVFAGPLTVRGFATYIDHGQGIFSGYFHQQEVLVNEGDLVERGQLIGLIGATGRVTGPHLHWEIWANGVQVNPVDWVLTEFPTGEIR